MDRYGKARQGLARRGFLNNLIKNQMTEIEKADIRKEQRLRRALIRQGLQLVKSRIRNTHLNNWGGYRIIDPNYNTVEAGVNYDLSLKDVEDFVNEV